MGSVVLGRDEGDKLDRIDGSMLGLAVGDTDGTFDGRLVEEIDGNCDGE